MGTRTAVSVDRSEFEQWPAPDGAARLRLLLSRLCGLEILRFPRVHPAEISKELLDTLRFRPAGGIYSTQRPRDPISDRRSVIVDASNHVHAESVARSCRARFAWSAAARRQRAGQAPGVVDKGTRHAAHLPGRGYRGDDVPHGRVPGAAGHRLSSSEPFVGCVARRQGSGGSGFRIAMARWQGAEGRLQDSRTRSGTGEILARQIDLLCHATALMSCHGVDRKRVRQPRRIRRFVG